MDPACGTAGFLISAYKHILKENSSNYDPAQDRHAFDLHGIKLDELTVGAGKRYKGDQLTPDDRSRLTGNVKGLRHLARYGAAQLSKPLPTRFSSSAGVRI